MRGIILLLCLSVLVANAHAQGSESYPKGYFRNPLNIPIELAGNFGECRPNHFHSGLDIKTQAKENFPVFAAADGYVSRIKMEPGGFGHALYLTHPNGYTTVYAHLNDFMPAIQAYTRQQQYQKESWAVDLYLNVSQFPVKKGDQIAWSGNTGGSMAPHLHFEIRDTKTAHPVNPQRFGFEIKDNIAPKPTKIAIYDLSNSVYDQRPKILSLQGNGNNYTVAGDTVRAGTNLAGIGVHVFDYMNGSQNTLNFYKAELYSDGILASTVVLEEIGYEETRYLHAYADYMTKQLTGAWYQSMFRLPGNFLTRIFPNLNKHKGAVDLSDGAPHAIRMVLTDNDGNSSTISFYMTGAAAPAPACEGLRFQPNRTNSFEDPNLRFTMGKNALYDDVCFTFAKDTDIHSYSDRFTLHKSYVPVHSRFTLAIKPNKPIPFAYRNKIALAYNDGKDENAEAAKFDDGWYTARIRKFGMYKLVADTIPPVLKALQPNGADLSKARHIRFSATDAITSVKHFRAELNGKWLCFAQKGKTFVYTFDEHCPKGKHRLVVTATDENDNTSTLTYTFTR